MAFIDMFSEINELVPGMSRIRAKKLVNRAWKYVQDSMMWSFQLQQGGFSTPNITTGGSITASLNTPTIVGDATASAAWIALGFVFAPTTQQFRVQGYSIYSIIAMDATNPDAVVLTLDRNFVDPLPFYSGVGYQMYQAYQPMPPGFKRFLTCVDMFDNWSMDIWTSRRTIDLDDPTRLLSSNPTTMAALGQDLRGRGTPNQSATYGQQLYEMYPYPSTAISYQWYGVVEWPYLVNNSDTLPYPIDEEVVVQKALTWAYRDAEARRDVMAAKGSVGNFLALKKQSEEDFLIRLKTLRLLDRDAVDSYMADMRAATSGFPQVPYYNSRTNQTGPGW